SFARIFFRNAINTGLPILESPEAVDETQSGDILEVDLLRGQIRNVSRGKTFVADPYPKLMMEIVNAGGLIEYTRNWLESG
ncbi:MAG: 3-isopropylmalate dehydratase small subunit, partial [Dehalococcoidia bacterium]|nr:3-isopropylmalate dehydratase small subunit [Dehalococcoidia bacterium]